MIISCDDRIVADKVKIANTFIRRFKGLMGQKSLAAGEGLLLMDCSSIHCFFMRMTIDAVFLSMDMTVLGTQTLTPWKIGRRVKEAAHVLELAGGAAWVSPGDVLKRDDTKKPNIHKGGACSAGTNE